MHLAPRCLCFRRASKRLTCVNSGVDAQDTVEALEWVTAQINEYLRAHPTASPSDPTLRELWARRRDAEIRCLNVNSR